MSPAPAPAYPEIPGSSAQNPPSAPQQQLPPGTYPPILPDQRNEPGIVPGKAEGKAPYDNNPSGPDAYIESMPGQAPNMQNPSQYYGQATPSQPGAHTITMGHPTSAPPLQVMGFPALLVDANMSPEGVLPTSPFLLQHNHLSGAARLCPCKEHVPLGLDVAADAVKEQRGMFCGTLTLFLGMCFPFLWLIGGCLPFCVPRSARVRSIGLANSIAFLVTALLVILLPVLFGRRR
ncbi:hypothetical protein QJQ45_017613 [Haematococcus lacustris]|nr:hypothetical protein QJQ45_017613 [Haematococcus lacustris]